MKQEVMEKFESEKDAREVEQVELRTQLISLQEVLERKEKADVANKSRFESLRAAHSKVISCFFGVKM